MIFIRPQFLYSFLPSCEGRNEYRNGDKVGDKTGAKRGTKTIAATRRAERVQLLLSKITERPLGRVMSLTTQPATDREKISFRLFPTDRIFKLLFKQRIKLIDFVQGITINIFF